MLTPNQIKMQGFPSSGRGAYRAADVDDFMQRIYADYSALYSENAAIKKKFSSLSGLIEEYNSSKNAIATALVTAQSIADKTINSAKETAEEIIREAENKAQMISDEKIANAIKFAEEKKAEAEETFKKTVSEIETRNEKSKTDSDKFIESINMMVAETISKANERATAIVNAAYDDARLASERADNIIFNVNDKLEEVKQAVATFKKNSMEMINVILPALEELTVDENFSFNPSKPIDEILPDDFKISETPVFSISEDEVSLPTVESVENMEFISEINSDEKPEEDSSEIDFIKELYDDISSSLGFGNMKFEDFDSHRSSDDIFSDMNSEDSVGEGMFTVTDAD